MVNQYFVHTLRLETDNSHSWIRGRRRDHRKKFMIDLHESIYWIFNQTCNLLRCGARLKPLWQTLICITIRASTQENLSSGFPSKRVSNRSPQLQRLENWNFTCCKVKYGTFQKAITKALIRLRGCADWSAPVLFANPWRQVFSRRGPKPVFRNLQTAKVQTNLRIRTVWLASLLLNYWKVWYLDLLQGKFQCSS